MSKFGISFGNQSEINMKDRQVGGNEFPNAKQRNDLDVVLSPYFRQMPDSEAAESTLPFIFVKYQCDAFRHTLLGTTEVRQGIYGFANLSL